MRETKTCFRESFAECSILPPETANDGYRRWSSANLLYLDPKTEGNGRRVISPVENEKTGAKKGRRCET